MDSGFERIPEYCPCCQFGKVNFGLVRTEVGTDVAIGTTGELVGFLMAL